MYRLPSFLILGVLLLVPLRAFGDEAKILKFKCQLMSGMFELDPTEARKLVPNEYELSINDKGRAVSRFYVVSNCQEAFFNNKDILSNDFGYSEVLIDIHGPPEIPKIKGAKSNSLTRYHYKLWGQVAGAKADAFFQEIRKTNRPIKR